MLVVRLADVAGVHKAWISYFKDAAGDTGKPAENAEVISRGAEDSRGVSVTSSLKL